MRGNVFRGMMFPTHSMIKCLPTHTELDAFVFFLRRQPSQKNSSPFWIRRFNLLKVANDGSKEEEKEGQRNEHFIFFRFEKRMNQKSSWQWEHIVIS
jgi:hypothetical protein